MTQKQKTFEDVFLTKLPDKKIKISMSSNKSWLTLFYSLPKEFLDKHPIYFGIPRSPYEVLRTDKYDKLIMDDAFLEFVWDYVAWWSWKCFLVPDKNGDHTPMTADFRDYSETFPISRLAYTAVGMLRSKYEEYGLSFQALFSIPPGMEVPWLTLKQFDNLVGNLIDRIVYEQNWQPIIDDAWLNRCEDDFNPKRVSRDRIDSFRRWNHTRAKSASVVSLEQMQERTGETDDAFEVVDPRAEFDNDLISELNLERFAQTLPERDRKILELKMQGLTDQEIAEKVGFTSHSAVVKRKQQIAKRFQEYADDEYEKHLNA